MLTHFHLSNGTFERLIKLQLQAAFQPIDEPFKFKDQFCYMDGFDLRTLEIGRSPRQASFALHRISSLRDEVTSAGPAHGYRPVVIRIAGAIMLVSTAAVRSASVAGLDGRYGLPARPDTLEVPILGAEFDVFFSVDAQGLPTLNVSLHSLPGAELLGDSPSFLTRVQNMTVPFPVTEALADVLEPGHARVINAGIVSLGESVAIRIETGPVSDTAQAQRMSDWLAFFEGQQPSQLGRGDWAIDLPAHQLGAKIARDLDDQFNDPELAKRFKSRANAWAGFVPQWPGFQFHKEGTFVKACSGLDVRAKLIANVKLSVPVANILRVSVGLELDLDDWDSSKCEAEALLNPLAGIITTFDQGLPWYTFPLVSILLPLASIAFGLGGDDVIVREAIKGVQEKAAKKGAVTIVRTSDTHFTVDIDKKVTTPLTRDWMVVQEIAPAGDRIVLRGAFTGPDLNRLPRLRGVLSDGFGAWSKKDHCSTNVKWVTTATLELGLEDDNGAVVRNPIVPIRYGIDVETVDGKLAAVGQTTWRIVDDRQGVYTGASTLIHWTGGPPGVFEFQLTQPHDPFASAPYALRMQLFTSVGVREFEIPAPPRLPRPPQTRQEQLDAAAERISSCYIFSTLLTEVKALQVLWRPNPPPLLKVAQHWQILVRGLERGDQLSAWNAQTRELLAETGAFKGGLTEVSLIMPAGRPMSALQLTLNEESPLSMGEYADRAANVHGRQATGKHPVLIRQTPLYLLAEVELAQVAEAVVPRRSRDGLTLFATGAHGLERIELGLLEPGRFPVSARSPVQLPVLPQLPSGEMQLRRGYCAERATTELTELDADGRHRLIARYFARPWYDGGGISDQFFVQLDETRTVIAVYARGATRDVTPEIGDRSHGC